MDNNSFYTKGDKDEILTRVNQVHTITMYCPINDFGITTLRSAFELMLPKYKSSENLWKGVPSIDALNVFILTTSLCDNSGVKVDKAMLSIIFGSLKMFKRLKYINFKFTDDTDIENAYQILLKKNKEGIKKSIYTVEVLEMNLSDMFSQRIIDLLNKIFIHSELLSNSYLERRFRLDFKYDDYIAFMDMFIGNNRENLTTLDTRICDYLRTFPSIITSQKPTIRLITNYKDTVIDL